MARALVAAVRAWAVRLATAGPAPDSLCPGQHPWRSSPPVAPPAVLAVLVPVPSRTPIGVTPAPVAPARAATARSSRLPVTVMRVRGSLPPTRNSGPTLPVALSPAPPPTRLAARSPVPAPSPALATPVAQLGVPIRVSPAWAVRLGVPIWVTPEPAPAVPARATSARSSRLPVTAGRVRGSPLPARSSCPTLPAVLPPAPPPTRVSARSTVPALAPTRVSARSTVPAPASARVPAWDAPVDGGLAPRPNCAS